MARLGRLHEVGKMVSRCLGSHCERRCVPTVVNTCIIVVNCSVWLLRARRRRRRLNDHVSEEVQLKSDRYKGGRPREFFCASLVSECNQSLAGVMGETVRQSQPTLDRSIASTFLSCGTEAGSFYQRHIFCLRLLQANRAVSYFP